MNFFDKVDMIKRVEMHDAEMIEYSEEEGISQ